ncbi:MAG TPA: 3'-5' exonuclease [Candidatus Aquicultor sp.]
MSKKADEGLFSAMSEQSGSYDSSSQRSIEQAKFVILDTELTGLNGRSDSIVSVGALKMVGKRIHTGDIFYRLVRPETELTGKSIIIHGITPADVESEPDIEAIMPDLLEFVQGSILVGYCPQIDLEFLNKEIQRLYGRMLDNQVIDVLTVYRWVGRRMLGDSVCQPLSLYEIARNFDIAPKGSHNALMDAFITAQVFQRLLHILSDLGIEKTSELYNISNPSKVGDALRYYAGTGNM